MYLKKLEIYGFKSFAERIEINFKDGITAIVGPNGSGKSNILDAIKWVLGEQKIKSLRGQKMEDVIFSGTQVHKALGYAEVTLSIDNTTGIFPMDYNEIIVTRRLFRSGDSEYYINKSSCRLKDIQDLFSDTGLGKEGYSIIGQGKIDHIVSSNPNDRRLLLEEAAGIVKYKNRKLESERKLDKTQENLYRITDIIAELENQLKPLGKQSEKAKIYLDLREQLKKIELNLFVHNSDEMGKELKKLHDDREITTKNIQDKLKTIEDKDTQFQNIRKDTQNIENEISKLNEDIVKINQEIEENNTKIQVSCTKIDLNGKSILEIKQEILQINNDTLELTEKLNKVKNEILHMEQSLVTNSDDLKTLNEKKKSIIHKQSLITEQHLQWKQSLESIENKITELKNNIKIIENKISYYKENKANLKVRLNETTEQQSLHIEKKEHLINQEISIDTKIADNKKLMEIKKNDYITYKSEYIKLEKQLNVYQNNYQVYLSKYKMMSNQDETNGYYNSVRLLLNEKIRNEYLSQNLYDVVGNLLDVQKEYALAIETSLGNSVQNLVTKDESAAHECIKLLNKNKWGRATFLPLNIISGSIMSINKEVSSHLGFIDIASNLITFESQYNNLFQNLLGRVIIVRDFVSGQQINKILNYKYKIVTLQGEIFFPGGAIVGGNQKNNNKNIIQRKEQLKELKEEIRVAKEQIISMEKQYKLQKNELSSQESLIEDFQMKYNELLMEKKLAQQSIIQMNAIVEEDTSSITKIKAEIDSLLIEEKAQLNLLKETEEKITELNEGKITIENTESPINQGDSMSNDIEKLNREILDLTLTIAKYEERNHHLQEQKNDIIRSIENNNNRYNAKNNQLIRIETENIELNKNIEEVEKLLNELKQNKQQVQEINYTNQNNKNRLNMEFDEIQADMKILNNEHMLLTDGLNKIELIINNKENELQTMQNNIYENYGANYIMACDYRSPIENMKSEIKRSKNLKDQIRNLGSVNVDAIEQYKDVKERYEFLSEQKNDLIKAKDELSNIIQEIAINMEQQFVEKFKLIQDGFNKTFRQLFNGGSARLLIEDNGNIMETGIEIEAQPPGKKLKNISLLSGGEKALTAIALLFAIITIKPTPFCVLDEIDAALDDSNVERFSKFLETLCEENQFITITHRKGTMEMAHRLYGVSMGNDGISKIISVELSDILQEEV